MLGLANYERISIGDIVSWTSWRDRNLENGRIRGIVLNKFIDIQINGRKICALKVACLGSNEIVNILAISVKIESKITT